MIVVHDLYCLRTLKHLERSEETVDDLIQQYLENWWGDDYPTGIMIREGAEVVAILVTEMVIVPNLDGVVSVSRYDTGAPAHRMSRVTYLGSAEEEYSGTKVTPVAEAELFELAKLVK